MIRFKFLVWLSVTLATILSASMAPRIFVHVVILFLLLIPLFAGFHLWFSYQNLNIHIQPRQRVLLRQQLGYWDLNVTNIAHFNTIRLIYGKDIYILHPQQTFSLPYHIDAKHVGHLYPKVDANIKLIDIFGLFSKQLLLPKPILSYVVPFHVSKHQSSLSQDFHKQHQQLHSNPYSFDEEELDSIHPLTINRPLRHIHWKLSARLQQWMVKKYYQTSDLKLMVFLELKHFQSLDHRDQYFDFVTQFMNYLSEQSISTSLVVNAKAYTIGSTQDLQLFLAQLTDVEPVDLKTSIQNYALDQSLNLIILSEYNPDNFEALLDYEKYFSHLQVIQFSSSSSTINIPPILQQLAIQVLEYDDATN